MTEGLHAGAPIDSRDVSRLTFFCLVWGSHHSLVMMADIASPLDR